MVGFDKAGQLVGYNYQQAEDFKSAFDALFMQVRMKTSAQTNLLQKLNGFAAKRLPNV